MADITEIKIGDYTATCVRDSLFAVDGGAMFHIVPRALWKRKIAPDKSNRVYSGLNCLLLRGHGKTILYDVGVGNKLSDKLKKIYDIKGDTTLLNSLKQAGVAPEDIDIVIPSHLHLDHAGWLTVRNSDGDLVPTFPNAKVIIQKAEWKVAHDDNELTRGSYMRDDFDPLEQMGLVTFIDGEYEITDSVKLELTGAHSPGHQIMTVKDGADTMMCPCEIIPSTWHLRLSWVTGYDQEPVRVVEVKRELMQRAAKDNWVVFLTHDPSNFFGYLRDTGNPEYEWEPYGVV